MKKKLVLQDFAEAIATSEGVDVQEAERFLHAFFDVIEQGLEADKYVKIKGLGTFKLVSVSERESVNINTGERFLIGGHTKISFTPETSLKELVNRPFSHFETVDLSDETELEEFETIDRDFAEHEEEEEKEENTQDQPATPVRDEERKDSVTEKEAVEEKNVPEEEPSEEEEEIVLSSPERFNDQQTTESPLPPPATWNITNVTVEEEEEELDIPEQKTKEAAFSQAEETTDSAEDIAEKEPFVTTPRSIIANNEYQQPKVDYTYTDVPPRRKRNLWKTATIGLATLLLMLLSYFVGYYRILCPCSYPYIERLITAPTQPEAAEIAQPAVIPTKDTVVAPQAIPTDTTTHTVTPADSSPNPPTAKPKSEEQSKPAKEEAKPQAQPVKPTHHLVGKGDNLYKISRRYYGNDSYVPAIIKLNNLEDANCISQGMRLKLP